MTTTDTASVSLDGTGERPDPGLGNLNPIKEYYSQLKAPYLSFQHSVRQRIFTEGERLHSCQRELQLCGKDKFRAARLKEKALGHQRAIDEMESGLVWAASKIRSLDAELEDKILLASRHSNADAERRMAPRILQMPGAAFSAQ